MRPRARIDALDSDRARDGVFVAFGVALDADARVSMLIELGVDSAAFTLDGAIISE